MVPGLLVDMPESAPASSRSRPTRARLLTALGAGLTIAGLAFVIRRLTADWDEVSDALAGVRAGWLVAAVVTAVASMVAMALPWRDVLAVLGARVGRADTTARYFVGEVGKYVPGGIWPVVGRGEMVARAGVPRRVAYLSVVASLGVLYLAAAVFVTACAPLAVSTPWAVALATPVALAALHPVVVRRMRSLGARLRPSLAELPVPSWPQSLGLVARYLPAWVLVGTATWLVAVALDGDAGWIDVAPAAAASWIIGFVIVPAPGGVGVREAAFVTFATSLSGGTGAAVALLSRVLFMVVDAAGAAIASALLGLSARRDPTPDPTPDSSV